MLLLSITSKTLMCIVCQATVRPNACIISSIISFTRVDFDILNIWEKYICLCIAQYTHCGWSYSACMRKPIKCKTSPKGYYSETGVSRSNSVSLHMYTGGIPVLFYQYQLRYKRISKYPSKEKQCQTDFNVGWINLTHFQWKVILSSLCRNSVANSGLLQVQY